MIESHIATIKKKAKNTYPTSSVNKPGDAIYLDMNSPLSKESIAPSAKYKAWLIVVDAYSRYTVLYGMESISTSHTINRLQHYQTNYKTGNFEYINICKIKADTGSQFVSDEFQSYCAKKGIILSIAAPTHQEQNTLAKCTWQTVAEIMHSNLVHAHLPDTFAYYAAKYAAEIFKGARFPDEKQWTPYELFHEQKPHVSLFRIFGCPCVAKTFSVALNDITNTAHISIRKRQRNNIRNHTSQRGVRGIFLGFKYMFHLPGKQKYHLI